jgi:hypothetical protein
MRQYSRVLSGGEIVIEGVRGRIEEDEVAETGEVWRAPIKATAPPRIRIIARDGGETMCSGSIATAVRSSPLALRPHQA